MPIMHRDGTTISYEVSGAGYPLVLFAPGGMNSVARLWGENHQAPGQPMPWFDPTTELSDDFRVVAMDQRNAGDSSGPIQAEDGWATYTSDHLALLGELNINRTHAMGGCIGSSYSLGLVQAAPERVSAAVLQNPIGLTADNRPSFMGMFDSWATALKGRREDVTDEALSAFRQRMYGGDFVFSVDRDFVAHCPVPLLVLAGNDVFHPRAVAEEIADLAPSAELIIDWAGPERHASTRDRVREFLLSHTPAGA